jgi:hypothetical protein
VHRALILARAELPPRMAAFKYRAGDYDAYFDELFGLYAALGAGPAV